VALLLRQIDDGPRPCSYLPAEEANLRHMLLRGVTPEDYDHLMERGYRRFGIDYFRPVCAACSQCLPTRIPIASFRPSRSQRRAMAHCARFRVQVGSPVVDDARLALHLRWHETRENARGWEPTGFDEKSYARELAYPHPWARELSLWDGDALVAVGLFDETPRALSAVYFFYDPAIAMFSPGVANVIALTERARALGLPHVYLGFRVDACPSLAYKARFTPQETLVGWPALDEAPVWRGTAAKDL
jgi:leucyl-tRNA---protein transferase